jgi:GTP-binding nuclear protein Ran
MTSRFLIVGDGGVGKTVFLKHIMTGNFDGRYFPTLNNKLHQIEFLGNQIECIDTVGQDVWRYNKISEHNVDGIIIMFDLTRKITIKNLSFWIENCPQNIPVVVVGNKYDCSDRHVLLAKKMIKKLEYFEVSVRKNHNASKPLQYLQDLLYKSMLKKWYRIKNHC